MSSSANPLSEALSPLRGCLLRLGRWLWLSLVAASTAIVAVGGAATYWIASLRPAPLGQGVAFFPLLVDRHRKPPPAHTTPARRSRFPAAPAGGGPPVLS